jgi:hypothetical protein
LERPAPAAPDDPQRNPGAAVRGVPRALRALAVRDLGMRGECPMTLPTLLTAIVEALSNLGHAPRAQVGERAAGECG